MRMNIKNALTTKITIMEIDFKGFRMNGFLMLFVHLVLMTAATVACFFADSPVLWAAGGLLALIWLIFLGGYMQLEPNEAKVMVFFGKYKGTFKNTGFFWVNPFITKKKLSLRARNMDVEPIKVNDKAGNPVMIGLVLVWRLKDTYRAMFDIDAETLAGSDKENPIGNVVGRMRAFEYFVRVQSDAALRQVAGQYAYDDNETEGEELTLRSGGDEINEQLEQKLNERLEMAGIEIIEARINYLAYAPEIAAVMLRRQQASAIISAREKIVDGAVSMVKMALDKLSSEKIVELDEGKKADMVGNLLVVLCADEAARPVVETGSARQ